VAAAGGRVGIMANEFARSLRKQMTPQEVKLWVHLRSWRKNGFHFRRQAPRGRYVVDFVCLKHRLMVEIDGGQHNFDAHAQRDAERDNHFTGEGFRVLRFWNNEIDRNLEGVLTLISEALRNPPPGLALLGHPPPSGEGSSEMLQSKEPGRGR
jgi:very-short-patch-repair endonuclease